jgi:hypothetical protein
MPNRILKESICTSNDIQALSPQEEVFFYRLIVNCDDFGRLDARLPILKSKLYPLKDNIKSSDIERYLLKLSDGNPLLMIKLYYNANIRYLQINKWEKHQQIRAKRSKYPSFEESLQHVISNDINGNQMNAYVPENPIQSNPIQSESESITKKEYTSWDNPDAILYKPYVRLLEKEHQLMISELGEKRTKDLIIRLNGWIEQIGLSKAKKDYKSHKATMMNWHRKDVADGKYKPEVCYGRI